MTDAAVSAKPPLKRKRLLIILGGVLAVLMLCCLAVVIFDKDKPQEVASTSTPAAQVAAKATATETPIPPTATPELSTATPEPSNTPAPTETPLPTATPTATPDVSIEAKQVHTQVMDILTPADEAMTAFKDQAGLIAEGESADLIELYRLAKDAHAAWDAAGTALFQLHAEDERLEEAIGDLWLCTVYRKEAFAVMMDFIDDQKPSYITTYEEKMKESDRLLLFGLAKIISLAGATEE